MIEMGYYGSSIPPPFVSFVFDCLMLLVANRLAVELYRGSRKSTISYEG